MEEVCQELLQFLQLSTRLELKLTATKNVLALTASADGRKLIVDNKSLLEAILILTKDSNASVVEDCYNSLVNLSSEDHVTEVLLERYNIIPEFVRVICDINSKFSHKACMIFSNLTRSTTGSAAVANCIADFCDKPSKDAPEMNELLEVFYKHNYNKHDKSLDYLASFFSNLTQLPQGRNYFLDPSKNRIQKLFAYLGHASVIRRGGIAALLRNCCFDYESHQWLLSDKVDILSHILLPLAGGEEFDDDDNDKLPIDLQYLPPDKQREQDPDIIKILLETVMLLCADKPGRMFVRSKNTYVIIRELHKWVKISMEEDVSESCEKLVQILISDEPEDESANNLMTYEIPEEHKKHFENS